MPESDHPRVPKEFIDSQYPFDLQKAAELLGWSYGPGPILRSREALPRVELCMINSGVFAAVVEKQDEDGKNKFGPSIMFNHPSRMRLFSRVVEGDEVTREESLALENRMGGSVLLFPNQHDNFSGVIPSEWSLITPRVRWLRSIRRKIASLLKPKEGEEKFISDAISVSSQVF